MSNVPYDFLLWPGHTLSIHIKSVIPYATTYYNNLFDKILTAHPSCSIRNSLQTSEKAEQQQQKMARNQKYVIKMSIYILFDVYCCLKLWSLNDRKWFVLFLSRNHVWRVIWKDFEIFSCVSGTTALPTANHRHVRTPSVQSSDSLLFFFAFRLVFSVWFACNSYIPCMQCSPQSLTPNDSWLKHLFLLSSAHFSRLH